MLWIFLYFLLVCRKLATKYLDDHNIVTKLEKIIAVLEFDFQINQKPFLEHLLIYLQI